MPALSRLLRRRDQANGPGQRTGQMDRANRPSKWTRQMDHANGQGLNDASGQMMFRPHRAMHGISPMAPVSGERWSVAGRCYRRSVAIPSSCAAARRPGFTNFRPATPNIDKAFYTVYGDCGRPRVERSPEWGTGPIDSDLDFEGLRG